MNWKGNIDSKRKLQRRKTHSSIISDVATFHFVCYHHRTIVRSLLLLFTNAYISYVSNSAITHIDCIVHKLFHISLVHCIAIASLNGSRKKCIDQLRRGKRQRNNKIEKYERYDIFIWIRFDTSWLECSTKHTIRRTRGEKRFLRSISEYTQLTFWSVGSSEIR